MQLTPINHIEIRDGRPFIAGTGYKVAIIASMHVHGDAPVEWIVENYDLTPAQVHAALSYYYDHAEEIDRYVQEGVDMALAIGISSDELLEQIRQRNNGDNTEA